ncbi:Rhamnulose-1-phosphate aldolase [Brachyspira suanatina]|uniref:Rhamnulose-1-phosphate aldolase n=1 Tax=Brachyspira suanatina TaxID=381802 RepID=A0A0G4K9A5_9SPIR|nr:rhamnulose-1-phosphate aldolase [Brachyspira suanatina]CRF34615.1 Rhamnulose-1-phosphate aldolase [Brachyspira suanatina]
MDYNIKFVKGFIELAKDGYLHNWHERNGGNLSYRLTEKDVEEASKYFKENNEYKPIGVSVPKLANEYFMVTGSGKFFKNVDLDTEDSTCIIQVDNSGDNYRVLWGLKNGGRPTSELPTHLMNHEIKKITTDNKHRVIYHCHPTNVIALTFVLPLDHKIFTRELWEMATECPVVFPNGIGIVEWMVPGGRDIAIATSKLMHNFDAVIWAHHGLFCSGEDYDITFGLAHTIEKSAEILVKVLSMSNNKRQTILPQNFRDLAVDFKLTLPEEYLYEKK